MKKEWIAELKKMQKSYQEEISPDDLPFDLTAELGEVVTVELKSPGVYYIATKKAGDIPECPEGRSHEPFSSQSPVLPRSPQSVLILSVAQFQYR